MAISLSDVRFTEREIRTIRETAEAIRKENRRESPRRLRISNLSERISLTIKNAQRRTLK